ncbi:MAG: peptidylprolyl isomerase [Acidiferrobacteraceae bacterium]
MKIRNLSITVLLVSAALLAACGQQGYKDKSATVATVPVAANEQERKQVIDQLVTGQILANYARKEKLNQDADFYVARKFANRSLLARAAIGKYLEENPVTPQQVKARYEELKKEKQLKVSHILVKSEDEAKAVLAELKKGKSFAALAKAKSIDVDSAQRGGSLGWITRGALAPELYDSAIKLKTGHVGQEPVKSPYGWHVIRLDSTRAAKIPPFSQKIAQALHRQMQSEDIQTFIKSLKKKAKIDVTEAKKAPPAPAAAPAPAPAPAPTPDKKDSK